MWLKDNGNASWMKESRLITVIEIAFASMSHLVSRLFDDF